jgi:hypothetical protein
LCSWNLEMECKPKKKGGQWWKTILLRGLVYACGLWWWVFNK